LKFKSKNSKKIILPIIGYALYEPQFQTIILYFPKKTIYANQGFRLSMGGEWGHSPRRLPWAASPLPTCIWTLDSHNLL